MSLLPSINAQALKALFCCSGGLETLFGNAKEHSLQVEPKDGEVGLHPLLCDFCVCLAVWEPSQL